MFDLVNAPDVIAAMKGGSDATPRIRELGPYYYAVKWNYTDFEWSWDHSSLNFTSREELVFCGGVDGIPGRTSEDDLVTNINLAYQAAKATGRTWWPICWPYLVVHVKLQLCTLLKLTSLRGIFELLSRRKAIW